MKIILVVLGLKNQIFTEKSTYSLENNKYTFDICTNINKNQIRFFFTKYYKISILKINTHIIARKKRRVLTSKGYKKQKKRVILSFKSSQNLPSQFYSR